MSLNLIKQDSDSYSESDETNEETAIINPNRVTRRYFTLNNKVELGEMAKLYFNKTGLICFYLSLCIYLYGDLAIYVTAISKTVVDLSCNNYNNDTENYLVKCWDSFKISKIDLYRIFVILFALSVGPFSYFNIQKTKHLQVFTSILRWSAFLIMIVMASLSLIKRGPKGHPKTFVFDGVPALIGSSIYSFMCHHSVPGLVAPFSDKQHVIRQIGYDYLLICIFYLFLAVTGSFAFENLQDLYTLNFIPTQNDGSGVGMEIIRYFLGAFPVFTLSTSFPIIAITLQNNLKGLFLKTDRRYNFFVYRLLFPSLAVLPPVFVAFSTHNLKTLVAVTGSYAGVLIQYVIPTFLVYFARVKCGPELRTGGNEYRSPFRGIFWIIFVVVWSVLCVIFVTVNFILEN